VLRAFFALNASISSLVWKTRVSRRRIAVSPRPGVRSGPPAWDKNRSPWSMTYGKCIDIARVVEQSHPDDIGCKHFPQLVADELDHGLAGRDGSPIPAGCC